MIMGLAWVDGDGAEPAIEEVWSRYAYGARYGHLSLAEMGELDGAALLELLGAVGRLLKDENKGSGIET